MNIINRKTKSSESGLLRRTAVVLAGAALVTLPASVIFAGTPEEDDISKYEVEKQVSAYEAKRLARSYLSKLGFSGRIGPGAARIRSITRDASTWIVSARVSGTYVSNDQRILYIDARTGVVSDVRPDTSPVQVAAE
jgi:hypothetical protein